MRSLAQRALRCVLAAAVSGALLGHAQAAGPVVATAPAESQVAIASPGPEPGNAPKILRTRFVVGLARKVKYQVFAISHPNRVVVELPDISLQLPAVDDNGPVGLVKSVRAGLAAPGKTRIVIGVTQPVVVESSNVEQDNAGLYRLAIIIRPAAAVLSNAGIVGFATRPSALAAGGIQPPSAPSCGKSRGTSRQRRSGQSSFSILATADTIRAQ